MLENRRRGEQRKRREQQGCEKQRGERAEAVALSCLLGSTLEVRGWRWEDAGKQYACVMMG